MAKILNGMELSKQMRDMVAELCCQFEFKYGHTVGLAIIQVGDNPSATSYVKNNLRMCKEVGISAYLHKFSEKTTQEEILKLIEDLNADEKVSGILLQLPLPEEMDVHKIACAIAPTKDVEGLNPYTAGNLYLGYPAFAPCTPSGVLELLKYTKTELLGKHAVIVGASNIVGKPMSVLLMREQATVTVCNVYTKNLKEICQHADILISAAGKAELITKEYVKPGATVIDVGINFKDKKLVGDVKFDEVAEVAEWITPVPGGVGPMTVTMLMFNTYAAAIEGKEEK